MEQDRPMTVEEVCKKYCGSYGFWQLRTFIIVGLVKVPSAWQMASILFVAPEPHEFWCSKPPQWSNLTDDEWKEMNRPTLEESDGSYDPCQASHPNHSVNSHCPEFSFLTSEHTIITQWSLVCDRSVLVSVSQCFYLFGILLGGVIAFFIIPRVGPRRVLLAAMLVQIITGVSVAFSPYLELKILMRCLVASACCTMFTAGYVICTDVVNSVTPRIILSCCYEHFWSLGVITLAILGHYLPNWQHLQLALSLPTLLLLLFSGWIPESPKWLFANEKFEEAAHLLSVAARLNNLPQPPQDLQKMVVKGSTDNIPTWSELLKGNSFIKMAAVHILWACVIVTYYGALLNVKNLGGHVTMNTIVAGIAEVVGVLIGLTMLLHCGSRWLVLGVIQIVGGIACLVCWFLPESLPLWETEAAMLALAMAGRVAIATALTLLMVAAGELWLPQHRKLAGFSSVTFARVFLLTAPFIGSTAMYGNNVSLSFFGAITVLGGLAALVIAAVDHKTH